MERLTDKRLAIPPGQWQEVTREEARELKEIPVPPTRDLYYRLSQIEDILCDDTDEYDLDRLSVLCNQRMSMREEVSQRFSLTAKIPLDRLRELAEADRLIGMTVYEPNKRGFISTYEIISVHISKYSILVGWNLLDGVYSNLNGFEISALGKTVFLTCEEAEAALKDRKVET